MGRCNGLIWRGALGAVAMLVLALGVARAEAELWDCECVEYLFESFVFPEGAQPNEQLEALSGSARLVRTPAAAARVLPLYQKALRSLSVKDEEVGAAISDGLAFCLLKQGRSLSEVCDALRAERDGARGPAARAGLKAVGERFARRCAGLTAAGHSRSTPIEELKPSRTIARPNVPSAPLDRRGVAPDPEGQSLVAAGSPVASGARVAERVGTLQGTVAVVRLPNSEFHVSDWVESRTVRNALSASGQGPWLGGLPELSVLNQANPPILSVIVLLPPGGLKLSDLIESAAAASLERIVNELASEAEEKARAGDREGALALLSTLVRDARGTRAAAEALGRALAIALEGAPKDAREAKLEWFERWVADRGGAKGKVQARLLVLQQRYRDGDFARSRDGLRAFLEQDRDSEFAPRAQLLLALAEWKAGDPGEANKVLHELVQKHPGHAVAPQAQFLVGYLCYSSGQVDAARAAFLRVVNDYPDSEFAAKALDFLGGEAAKRAEAQGGKPVWRALPGCSCPRAAKPITVDGRLDEAEWQGAAVLKLIHRDDAGKETPDPDATVKLLWDAQCLYVGFECKDSDVRSDAKERDDPVLLWDAFRVLLAPTPCAKDAAQFPQEGAYYDFLVAPNGVLSDAKVEYSRGVVVWQNVKNSTAWDSPNVRWAARVQGTLNDAAADKGWTAELAIPFANLGGSPIPGSTWRLDVLHAEKAADRERSLSSWAPFTGWLPQVREFGRIAFAPTEPK